MTAKSLTMNREGEFRVLATGPTHCGVDENLVIKYNMVCECDVKLDHRGFLFDQVNVDAFFKGIRRTELSCEKLCIDCAGKLMEMIQAENPKAVIRKMTLTLSPAPHLASMKFEWEKSKRKATKPFIKF
jgi:hypothetical protein